MTPLAAGMAPQPPRLYWVPAVGLASAIEHYRQAAGLAGVAAVQTEDATSVTLAAMGEADNAGLVRGSGEAAAAAADGLRRLDLASDPQGWQRQQPGGSSSGRPG